jgi:hypothetical protein
MNPARFLPGLITVCLVALLVGDAVANQRGTDVLLIPGLVLVVMAASSLTIVFVKPPQPSETHGVQPIAFSHDGPVTWVTIAAALVLIVPRFGIPLLTLAIAHYRGAGLRTAFLLGAGAAVMIEGIFLAALGLGFPEVAAW